MYFVEYLPSPTPPNTPRRDRGLPPPPHTFVHDEELHGAEQELPVVDHVLVQPPGRADEEVACGEGTTGVGDIARCQGAIDHVLVIWPNQPDQLCRVYRHNRRQVRGAWPCDHVYN